MEYNFADCCKNEEASIGIARSFAGELFLQSGAEWKNCNFNSSHKGYYPACAFTALAFADGMFYAAGVDEKENPHLFSSLMGGVWDEHLLSAKHPLKGEIRATGKITRILFDKNEKQIFLICHDGLLVTLPDCPKCIKISELRQSGAIDGYIKGRDIIVLFNDESEQTVGLDSALQYRVAFSFMQEQLKKGGMLVDVRSTEEYLRSSLPQSVHVSYNELDSWLEGQTKSTTIIFVCRVGVYADIAVKYARKQGFLKAYSMGGINSFSHVD